MITLTLQSVQTCIMAAFAQYRTGTPGTISVPTAQGNVNVTCVINDTMFNTGFPGYKMSTADVSRLRTWCTSHPGNISGTNWSFGFRGTSPSHPDSVNVTLISLTPNMFNFHVYLT
ncbi:hypothetical protein IM793_02710 [Pedobacter sp. MR2016-19]|uniref:hypothetical protein n=1 Tax=Pedobacter sp. MR2016-19 TaxID=2780089 RepID=UPI0018734F3A|nr:hypothetical protein [Pedobacter sp. MR2016-19]MBE5318057.1 hypothetical protein [Pedobacter sp. MR2016-19]